MSKKQRGPEATSAATDESAAAVVVGDPVVVPAEEPPPPAPVQSVSLDAWMRVHFGAKHLDQGAGFRFWCGKNGHARHSTKEWSALFDAFHAMPAGMKS